MHNEFEERIKDARYEITEKSQQRIDRLLSDLPQNERKRSYAKPILTAVAAALLLFVIITVTTPKVRAQAAQLIEWFYNAVFVHGASAPKSDVLPDIDGETRTYNSADELLADFDILLLTTQEDNEMTVSVDGNVLEIESFYGDIRVFQHISYDGKAYEHRVYSDGKDKDERYSIKIGDVELCGFVSDSGCYLIGELSGMWYEVSTDTASKTDFAAFTKTLILKGGGQ